MRSPAQKSGTIRVKKEKEKKKDKGGQPKEMKTENKMAELLEEFRAQTEEAEACGGEAGIESIAGLAARESGTENIGSDEPAARAGDLTEEEEEEINAEWFELLSGMYF